MAQTMLVRLALVVLAVGLARGGGLAAVASRSAASQAAFSATSAAGMAQPQSRHARTYAAVRGGVAKARMCV